VSWVWIVVIIVVAVVVVVALTRWLLAGGRERSPGRELPEEPPPT
jgi:flagellar basal body-associated protein FliL